MKRHDPANRGERTNWYSLMRTSAVRAGTARADRSTSTRTARTAERAPVVRLEGIDGNIGNDGTYEHHHVDAGSALPVAEQLPDAPLRSVPPNGAADAPRCDDAEPGHVRPVRQGEKRQEAAPTPNSVPLDPLELRTAPYPLAPSQATLHEWRSRVTERRFAGAPWHAGA